MSARWEERTRIRGAGAASSGSSCRTMTGDGRAWRSSSTGAAGVPPASLPEQDAHLLRSRRPHRRRRRSAAGTSSTLPGRTRCSRSRPRSSPTSSYECPITSTFGPAIWDDIPVDVMARLRRVPYFNEGYDVDGAGVATFNSMPALQITYREFSKATNDMVEFVRDRMA